jgi:hypothetical protein
MVLYQGTALAVPQKAAIFKGFSPRGMFPNSRI